MHFKIRKFKLKRLSGRSFDEAQNDIAEASMLSKDVYFKPRCNPFDPSTGLSSR